MISINTWIGEQHVDTELRRARAATRLSIMTLFRAFSLTAHGFTKIEIYQGWSSQIVQNNVIYNWFFMYTITVKCHNI